MLIIYIYHSIELGTKSRLQIRAPETEAVSSLETDTFVHAIP